MRTATAEIHLNAEGVIVVKIDRDARQDLSHARENLAAAIATGTGKKRPLLTDIRHCYPLTTEARRYYSGKILLDSFTSLGILIDASVFGKMMGNVYIQIARPGIPTRLFVDEHEALTWLKGHRFG